MLVRNASESRDLHARIKEFRSEEEFAPANVSVRVSGETHSWLSQSPGIDK